MSNTDNSIEYSKRLGAICDEQFQRALSRFDLGNFVEAAPIKGGLFGQNVFITSTKGQYVLRGVPHYDWQFPKEKFLCDLLHEQTNVPVAWPYLLDTSEDIFGWNYILMPRLLGESAKDQGAKNARDVAHALGENLAAMHKLMWPFAGEYSLSTNTIEPFAESWANWVVADVRRCLGKAHEHSLMQTSDADIAWVEAAIEAAYDALTTPFQACFVMNDYNPGNVVLQRENENWSVSGVFDLMEGFFGDGELDLMRLTASYLDEGQHQDFSLAQAFGKAYLHSNPPRSGFAARYTLYMLRDRLIIWEFGTRPDQNWFPNDLSLRHYIEPYTRSYQLFDV